MKPIFKTSAIFACLALLFVACDREPISTVTDYAGDPVVGTSNIWALSPGNGKFQIEWDVNDNENITGCYLTWSDGGSNVGEAYFTAEDDGIAPLASIVYTVEDLEAGEYSVTLTNTSDVEIVTMAIAKSVTVYDSSTYTGTVDITEVIHNGKDAELDITDALPTDCVGIIATYTKGGEEVVSDLLPLDAYTTTVTLSGADVGSTFSYVTCFQPTNAMSGEYVENAGSADGEIPGSTPLQPSSIEVNAGDRKAIVTWNVESDYLLYGSRLTYTTSGGISTTIDYSYANGEVSLGENIIEIPSLSGSESYTVEVRNMSEDEYLSRALTVENVTPYDYDEYMESCVLPNMTLAKEIISDVTNLKVSFVELGTVSCSSIEFVYEYVSPVAGLTKSRIITDFSEPTYITDAQAKAPCYYIATFELPENAVDDEHTITSEVYYMDCIYEDK